MPADALTGLSSFRPNLGPQGMHSMPDIQPFRGLRYDLGHVGSLADVVAPPYDVISPS